MTIYFVGEFGYEADCDSNSQIKAEESALEISSKKDTVIAVWDENDEIISVAICGSIFDKRDKHL